MALAEQYECICSSGQLFRGSDSSLLFRRRKPMRAKFANAVGEQRGAQLGNGGFNPDSKM